MAAIQIADWLKRLGLAQYLECFAERTILIFRFCAI